VKNRTSKRGIPTLGEDFSVASASLQRGGAPSSPSEGSALRETEEVKVKKVLVTLFLTALLGSAVAVGGASAQTSPTLPCTLKYGCWHN